MVRETLEQKKEPTEVPLFGVLRLAPVYYISKRVLLSLYSRW